jgi:hypothetical protein
MHLDSENRDLGNLDNKLVSFPAFPAWKASPLLRIRCKPERCLYQILRES